MDTAAQDFTFAPVTREQARLFAGIGRMLDRRGLVCGFAAPSDEVAEEIRDDWEGFLVIAGQAPGASVCSEPVPEDIGAYDAWRGGWPPQRRIEAVRSALAFWRERFTKSNPKAVVLWNGRDHVFVEAAASAARQAGIDVICLELGPLRQAPMTVAVSRGGCNAAARFRRPDQLGQPLTPWEAARLQNARSRFKAAVKPVPAAGRFVFLPLQVDDDTQLYYYAPHFDNQESMVQAVARAMPAGLPLALKLHPLCDPCRGRARYAPLLRVDDRIVSRDSDTLQTIAAAAAVVTNNSSAGIEALMLERPVVVLGEAHYRGRGFTHDYDGSNHLSRLIQSAVDRPLSADQTALRDRYLYELLHHELVHLEHHPLRAALDDEEYERLALRLADLVRPDSSGSDWQPLFDEIHALRESLTTAIQNSMRELAPPTLLIVTRFAAACLGDALAVESLVLEDLPSKSNRHVAGRSVCLLAPNLPVGRRAAAAADLRAAGARDVIDVVHTLSRQTCLFHVGRFNHLPRAMRDELYRDSAYWDYYLAQSGVPPENTPEKDTQASLLADLLWQQPQATVLEYGCGDGRILQRLATTAKYPDTNICGVDSSERMLQLARGRLSKIGDVKLIPADARDGLPFADAAFDACVTCGALQHIPAEDLPAVVDQLHRVTRRTTIHWEVFETHRPTPGEHYTNPQTSCTIHERTFSRFGPVRLQVRDCRPLTGQDSLLIRYNLDSPLLTVLTLHAIGTPDPTCESLDYHNMFLAPVNLGEVLDGLAAAGYTFLPLGEALAALRAGYQFTHKSVVITFDDAYASVFDVARPILEERGIRAAVFVPTDYIGQAFGGNPREGPGTPLPVMTADQIRLLRTAGWEIGAHSSSHRAFAGLTPDQAKRELSDSKAVLETMLGQTVPTFAFPYGEPDIAYRPEHLEMAGQAGYELALTMRPGFVPLGYNALDWPRVGIGIDATSDSVLAQLAALHRTTNGWPQDLAPGGPSLEERVRRVVRQCVESGIQRIALYGAGRHTAKLLHTTSMCPLSVLGIIDDDAGLHGFKRYGLPIYGPADITSLSPDAVLISSDQYEEAIYQRIAPLEASGIRVLRLHSSQP
jgi:peptidoglycan/xylan/chitin deacetylase (PgdA/CDA1 family)/protein-L-isoaspartate O-methyltransferase